MKHDADPCMTNEFDVSLGNEFETVPARVLPCPLIWYDNGNRTENVSRGVWRAQKLFEPSENIKSNNSWTILNLNYGTSIESLYDLKSKLQNTGKNYRLVS